MLFAEIFHHPLSMSSQSKLFQPITVGTVELQHRVALAPLTRFKATEKTHIPHTALVKNYYSQRGSTPGTLLISEATFISPQAGGYDHVPGIWSDEQIAAWKEITDAVHSKDSFIYLQLWSLGRAAKPEMLRGEDPTLSFVAPSAIKLKGTEETPRELTRDEIKSFVSDYAKGAANAVHRAGFDGVEIHGANGHLFDQFLQDVSNQRTDEYGGSIENRTRFALEVIDAIVKEVGAQRTALRISPWSEIQDMRMEDPKPTFTYLVTQIREKHPNFAYLHVIEPRANGMDVLESVPEDWDNDFIRDVWAPRPFIAAGGFEASSAKEAADQKGDLIAFGRKFIANPDLPLCLKTNIPLNNYNRETFYLPGEVSEGYTDYPFSAA
ncbi:NADH:flavin oxidoreductase/NADH oxidase [Cylindrobasidium torrendii FP15055 ss-10]|uniref:NADH:flavin oxidoreductase/NADH oxidase n=1 Tax=Cylindrobasidium torrendii FP15055 ss-10 TaxID=1314674 RepID=A0A0D7B2I1_9AGAR|nr:NADH:flavin oxidoreductase/NADH oxidase [Cylindrobasidium torrendii FP15055 ss-10]